MRGCPHCLKPHSRHDFAGGQDLLQHLIAGSQASHAAACSIRVRPTYQHAQPRVLTRSSSLLRGRA